MGMALPERAARWAAALHKSESRAAGHGLLSLLSDPPDPKGIWRSSARLVESRKEGCAFSLRNRGRTFFFGGGGLLVGQKIFFKKKQATEQLGQS